MKISDDILNELFEISPVLVTLERENVFTVPNGYFDGLSENILDGINRNEPAFFAATNSGLTVPEGYFENLSTNILNKIKAQQNQSSHEELKDLSPLLFSLQNKNVFTVPQGYFDELTINVINAVKPQAKVISMRPKNTVWRIAAAAVVTGFIAVSSLWFSQKQGNNKTDVAINQGKEIPAAVMAKTYKSEDQIDAAIQSLPDDDIIKYLQNTSSPADNESLTASLEEKELPAQQDYLLDEKTLQNYLDNIEVTSN